MLIVVLQDDSLGHGVTVGAGGTRGQDACDEAEEGKGCHDSLQQARTNLQVSDGGTSVGTCTYGGSIMCCWRVRHLHTCDEAEEEESCHESRQQAERARRLLSTTETVCAMIDLRDLSAG